MASSANVGSIHYDLTLDTKKFDTATKNVQSKIGGIGDKFKSMAKKVAIASAAIGAAGFAVKKGLIDPAIDLNESINAVEKTFGKASNTILEFGKTADKSAGLSKSAFNSAVVPIGAMLQNMGFEAEEAAKQSINLATRAADLASVFNTDLDTALTAIQAGLRGEADPLEKFGVGLKQSTVDAYALEEGLISSTGEMDTQSGALARLGLFFEQTEKFAGDFVDTSDQAANMARIQQARFENLRAEIGSKFLPVWTKLLEFTGDMITRLEGLMPVVRDVAADFKNRYGDAIKDAIQNIKDFAIATWDYLYPKLKKLWEDVRDDLIPQMVNFYQTIEPLVLFIRDVAVVAVGLLIDAIGLLARNFENILPILAGFGAMMLGAKVLGAITAVKVAIVGAGGLKVAMAGLGTFLGSSAMLNPWVVLTGVAVAAAVKVATEWRKTKQAIESAKESAKAAQDAYRKASETFVELRNQGQISAWEWQAKEQKLREIHGQTPLFDPKTGIPTFATGVRNFGGGLAVVGEEGPELVNLPKGSDVFNNSESRAMMGGKGQTNIYGNINISDKPTADYFLNKIDRELQLNNLGLSYR